MKREEETRIKKEQELKKREEEAIKKDQLLKEKQIQMEEVRKQKEEKKQLEYEIKRKKEEETQRVKDLLQAKSDTVEIDLKGSQAELSAVTIIVDANTSVKPSLPPRPSGIFITKDHLKHPESKRKQLSTESSTEIESSSIDLPTITMSADITLHDTIETADASTLRGSLDDFTEELPDDRKKPSPLSPLFKKSEAVKEKVLESSKRVLELSSKTTARMKELIPNTIKFPSPLRSSSPAVDVEKSESESVLDSEKKKKREEELKQKREDDLRKKELKLQKRLDLQRRRDDEKARRNEIRAQRMEDEKKLQQEVVSKYNESMKKVSEMGWDQNPFLKNVFKNHRNPNYDRLTRSTQSQPRDTFGTPTAPPRRKRTCESKSTERSASVSKLQTLPYDGTSKLVIEYFNRQNDNTMKATNPLFWKPFSWKTGRCRSLTELYLQKRTIIYANQEVAFENSLRYRLTNQYCTPKVPERPFSSNRDGRPPICPNRKRSDLRRQTTGVILSGNQSDTSTEPIYATVVKKYNSSISSGQSTGTVRRKRTNASRPIPPVPRSSFSSNQSDGDPPPPLPPKPDNLFRFRQTSSSSRSMSPANLGGSFGSLIRTRDASVSTDNVSSRTLEKEVQTSLEDVSSLKEDTKSRKSRSPIKPVSPIRRPFVVASGDENANFPQDAGSSSPVRNSQKEDTTTSKTIGSYHDAEDFELSDDHHDLDPDTFVGIDSIIDTSTSHFVSVTSGTSPDPSKITSPKSSSPARKKGTSLERKDADDKTIGSPEKMSDAASGMRRSSSALDVGVTDFSRSGSGGRKHKKSRRPSSGHAVRSAESSDDDETHHILETFWFKKDEAPQDESNKK